MRQTSEKRIAIVTLALLSNLGACTDTEKIPPPVLTAGDVHLKEATTDAQGIATFSDAASEEEVLVEVLDEGGCPIVGAQVAFFDGNGFEAFFIYHASYAPSLEIASHNSVHTYSLTSAPVQAVSYNSNGRERSARAAGEFTSYAQANWDDNGCRDAEWIETHVDFGAAVFKKTTGLTGLFGRLFDVFVDRAKSEWGDQPARVYSFRPALNGFPATTSLMVVDLDRTNECEKSPNDRCSPDATRVCYDGSVYGVDSCGNLGGLIDQCTSNEYCTTDGCTTRPPSCTPHARKTCYNGNLHWVDSCGAVEEVFDQCGTNEYCNGDGCQNSTPQCTSHARFACSGNAVHWQDSCGMLEEKEQDCMSTEYCSNGQCVGCTSHADRTCFGGDVYWEDSCGNREELHTNCSSGRVCSNGNCVLNCSRETCSSLGKQCGTWNDGCGGTLNCGSCSGGQACNGSGQCVAADPCSTTVIAGSDAPESHNISLGTTSGTFQFAWETYTQQDRITVSYGNSTLFDTGCVGSSGSQNVSFSGNATLVTVTVSPNCAGGSGTQWEFTVYCP